MAIRALGHFDFTLNEQFLKLSFDSRDPILQGKANLKLNKNSSKMVLEKEQNLRAS
jgi:hypothetical protein